MLAVSDHSFLEINRGKTINLYSHLSNRFLCSQDLDMDTSQVQFGGRFLTPAGSEGLLGKHCVY